MSRSPLFPLTTGRHIMSKKADGVGDAPAEYMTAESNGAGNAEDVISLDDYFAKRRAKFESEVINGRRYWFQSGSPKAKDALLAKHRKDDGLGNVVVEETMWMTDAIALTWVTGPDGRRVLDSEDKARRFHAEADVADERAMYRVAARMLGLTAKDEKDAARKNSDNGDTTSTLRVSPSTDSTLYPENS